MGQGTGSHSLNYYMVPYHFSDDISTIFHPLALNRQAAVVTCTEW